MSKPSGQKRLIEYIQPIDQLITALNSRGGAVEMIRLWPDRYDYIKKHLGCGVSESNGDLFFRGVKLVRHDENENEQEGVAA